MAETTLLNTQVGDPHPDYPHLRRIGVQLPMRRYLADTWRWHEFALTIAKGELRVQNQNTVLGQLWHLLNPMLLVAIYYLVFGVIADITRGQVENYVGFLIVGIIVFTYSQKAMLTGARIISKNQQLLQSFNFPRAVLPVSALIGETLAHFPALVVMFLLMLITGEPVRWTWLLVVPAFVLQIVFTGGLACFAARLAFRFRDVQQLLPYVLRLWFYISGILFSVDRIAQNEVRKLLEFNPMNAFVTVFRDLAMEGAVHGGPWLIATGSSFVVALAGFWYFRQGESEYANG